jgi:hypothetical protein
MADQAATLRRCVGSKRFRIEPHDAPVEDFPKQPSQKDGLGRMCSVHWNQYTAGLARDANARKAAEAGAASEPDAPATPAPEAAAPAEPERPKRKSTKSAPVAVAESPTE